MIELNRVTIEQGTFSLRDVQITIPSGQYAILMGATGSGKTTLVESICGLRAISSGKVLIDGEDVTRFPPGAREIGYVPQDAALFPAMRIDRQIAFSLEMRKVPAAQRRQRVEELAELLEISGILARFPHGLSGGERQRVALARALAFRPRLLCLDEPLSALDEGTKGRLRVLLGRVHEHENVTAMHITHSRAEARQLGTLHFELINGQIRNESDGYQE